MADCDYTEEEREREEGGRERERERGEAGKDGEKGNNWMEPIHCMQPSVCVYTTVHL